ncbi:MAG: 2-phosphosulfolactate phosphatase [Bacteroidota bacterium]
MKTIDVCLSPDLIHLHNLKDKNVVIVDILRATSCMVSGLAFGIDHIIPFSNLEGSQQ